MSAALAEELQRLEEQGSTGILRAGDGEFHLARGAIASVGCRRTIGLDRLAVEAGVATDEDLRRARAGEPGALLRRPRLETLARLSAYDAAYFLLETEAEAEFVPTEEHWLAPVCRIAPHALVSECARRRRPDAGPWTADMVSTVPVSPAHRPRRKRTVLTVGQAEVLAAADNHRTIADIARELGRTTYGCLVAVRDLTRAGLIEAPESVHTEPERRTRHLPAASLPARGRHAARSGAGYAAAQQNSGTGPPLPRRVPAPVAPPTSGRHALVEEASAAARTHDATTPTPGTTARTADRNSRGADTYSWSPPVDRTWQQVDRALLIRIRTALAELA
ncbi:MarR family transcriptional regulator [Nocardia ignorata]|uniref:Uncharacterized protein n=1 Tax=Nocardia ignorata TaxID=145285 RepID=A0A4R6P4M5_NOCIG|nr:MarR family transcriptional regulator [Nocardia ignorata]TDP32481.1 hypothetical protein DFR75_106274 [Nocardia ignorata]